MSQQIWAKVHTGCTMAHFTANSSIWFNPSAAGQMVWHAKMLCYNVDQSTHASRPKYIAKNFSGKQLPRFHHRIRTTAATSYTAPHTSDWTTGACAKHHANHFRPTTAFPFGPDPPVDKRAPSNDSEGVYIDSAVVFLSGRTRWLGVRQVGRNGAVPEGIQTRDLGHA